MKPLRILYVNWAPLSAGAEIGGGVNLYQRAVATRMVERGHAVASLSAGWEYGPFGRTRLRLGATVDGVATWAIVDSPAPAPSIWKFDQPELDLDAPGLEPLFDRFASGLRPDVVHFNSLEGVTPGCIAIARRRGARVIVSLHNYHVLCSQVHLFHRDREVCRDFDGGLRCVGCVAVPSRRTELLRRRLRGSLLGLPGAMAVARPLVRVLRDLGRSFATPREPGSDPSDRAELAARYAARRAGLVAGVNQADLLLAVSQPVAELLCAHGVDATRLAVCHVGTAIASEKPLPRTRPRPRAGEPVHGVFLGLAVPWKGLPLLLEALTGLPPEALGRLFLHVHARGVEACRATLDALAPRLAGLVVRDGYAHDELPALLRDADFGIVPPLWPDTAPQVLIELLALGVPPIAARIGGLPDFVRDGENGLLFEPGDAAGLTDCVRRVVDDPALLDALRARIAPQKTLAAHADELEAYYRGA